MQTIDPGGFMKARFAVAIAAIVASGVAFAQSAPQKAPTTKPTQVAQAPGAASTGVGTGTAATATAGAGFGLAPIVAGTLTAIGALGSNESTAPTPPKH